MQWPEHADGGDPSPAMGVAEPEAFSIARYLGRPLSAAEAELVRVCDDCKGSAITGAIYTVCIGCGRCVESEQWRRR